MTTCIVERRFDQPLDLVALEASSGDAMNCCQLHGVKYVHAYVSADRLRMLCRFEAPDAEAVRIVVPKLSLPFERVIPVTVHVAASATDDSRVNVVVERQFSEPAQLEALQAKEDAGIGCLELHRVRFLHTYFSLDRMRMFCVYDAPDAEAVRTTTRQTGLPFECIWPASILRF